MNRPGKGVRVGTAAWATLVSALVGCSRPLPEAGTPAAKLYRDRCGVCHRAVAPSSLKFPAWQMILPRMEGRLRLLGQPLNDEERRTIEAYLRRNSG